MSKIFPFFVLLLALPSLLKGQKPVGLDKSPMDMAYYPVDFAHDRKFAPGKVGDRAYIRVTYSRPAKNGRDLFGKLVPFGKVWRAGANESTEIKFYQDVIIQGKKIKAGNYSFFIIPNETEWTVIFNTDLDYWGAYSYTESNDVLRINVPVKKVDPAIENFTIQFDKVGEKEVLMQIGWDTAKAECVISF